MIGIFLDQETSGLDSFYHVVLEIACKILDLNTGNQLGEYTAVIKHSEETWKKRDPQSIDINGFNWELLQKGIFQKEVRDSIITLFQKIGIVRGKSVFICQNPSFDRPFFAQIIDAYTQEKLNWPYHWLDLASMYWAHSVEKAKYGQVLPDEFALSKDKIALAYKLTKEKHPHRAMQGVEHLLLCYEKVVGFPKK